MILVVDDHDDTRDFLVQLLQLEQYTAASASSGEKALEMLELQTPSLIILDFNMPRMSGHDVLAAIRADPRWAEIPVIIYSNDNTSSNAQQSIRLGAQAHVQKMSLSWSEFQAVIDRLRSDAKAA